MAVVAKEDVVVTDPATGQTKRVRAGKQIPPSLIGVYEEAVGTKKGAKAEAESSEPAKAERGPETDTAQKAPERDKMARPERDK